MGVLGGVAGSVLRSPMQRVNVVMYAPALVMMILYQLPTSAGIWGLSVGVGNAGFWWR